MIARMRQRASAPVLVLIAVILGAARPSAALAATAGSDTLAMLLDRWAVSVGGWERLARLHGMHLHARSVTSGVPETHEAWVTRDGIRDVATGEGSAGGTEWVCRGATAWWRDVNGKTQELAGRDRGDVMTNAFVRELVYAGLSREALARAGARDGGRDSTGALRIVHLRPPDGIACDLVLDGASGRPVRAVRRPYDDDQTIEFGEWTSVAGVQAPFRIIETDRGRHDTTVVVGVEPLTRDDAPRFARPADGPPDMRFASGDRALGIPFDFENDHIMIECRVNGSRPIAFMFDSGAGYNVINATRLAEFGLGAFGASTTTGGGATVGSAFTRVDRLEIGETGGAALLGQREGVLDLSGLEKVYGMPLGGLLGYDFASRFTMVVDYDRHVVDLYSAGTLPDGARGTRVPFLLEQNHPHARGAIVVDDAGAIPADWVIDSGAAESANLTAPFVREHRLLERARRTPAGAPSVTPGSEQAKQFFTQTSVRGLLRTLRIGDVALSDVPVNLQQGTTGAYASSSFSGTIGERTLQRFNTTYDYAHSALYLVPNAAAAKPFAPRTTFGATLVSDGPGYTVFTVTALRKDSPADSAGFRRGDVIAALDGKPAAAWRLAGVRAALAAEGSHHVAEVKREGQPSATLDFTVRLVSIEDR